MSGHGPDLFALGRVPYLDLTSVGADGEIGASLRPRYGGYNVSAQIAQLRHLFIHDTQVKLKMKMKIKMEKKKKMSMDMKRK